MSRKRTLLTVILLSATPAAASPGASPAAPAPSAGPTDHSPAPAPAPPPDAKAAPALLALRTQLLQTPRAEAQLATFRPLCDRDGYPLVGNVASKGDVYQPSQVCSYVRDAQKPHR
ncbi:MAG TPA: hypothetical protein VH165_15135 [Kofleriaceae bacterium]|jgi:hypothetical protein|nr:hypothetical protein [Kofleriaceae bacterium]